MGQVQSLQSLRCLVEEGSPYFWGPDSDSRAGPTQGQSLLCICAVLLLVLPTPSSTGRLQTQLPRTWPLRQPAAGSHPSTLKLEAVFPAPSKFQHSQKYRFSKGRQVSPEFPFCTGHPQPFHQALYLRGTGAAQMELPEAHCPQPSQEEGSRDSHRRVCGTRFGNNSERLDIARLHTQCCAPEQ